VLIVEEAMYDTSPKRAVLAAAGALARYGWEPMLFSLRRLPASIRSVEGAAAAAGLTVGYGMRRPRSLQTAAGPALARLGGAARRADVVVSGSEVGQGLLASWAVARAGRRPFGIWVHCDARVAAEERMPARLRPVLWRAYRGADGLAPVAGDLVAPLQALAPRSVVRVVPHGHDPEQTRRRAAGPLPAAIPPSSIVAVGPLRHQHGFDVLIRALAVLRAQGLRLEAVIAGEGEGRSELEALARQIGVADQVHLVGEVVEPQPLLAAAALVVFAARFDGYPSVVTDALTLGVPVIASDCPTGPADQLGGGVYGRLVAPGDEAALAAALADHHADPTVLAARAAARPPFPTPDDSAAALAAFLDGLAARRTSRRKR
jgi:glycosyltransferase involved in cell wall biosynthesis